MTKNETKPSQESGISEETLLKISKEIAIKFIEVGRITPTTFSESFPKIFTTVKETVREK